MRTILTFFGLKIAEALIVVFVPYGTGLLVKRFFPPYLVDTIPEVWMAGFI